MKKIALIAQDLYLIQHWQHTSQAVGLSLEIHTDIASYMVRANYFNDTQIMFVHDVLIQQNEHRLKQLTERNTAVLVLSNEPNSQQALPLFKLGIKGYLNTYTNTHRTQQVIQTIEAGNVWIGQNLLHELITEATHTKNQSMASNLLNAEHLTERELQTLKLILKGQSNLEIATELGITESTVKKHVTSLLEKYQVKDRLALVIKVKNTE